MSDLFENDSTAFTSLGLFAVNCLFNNGEYSAFNNDPDDVDNFYSQEMSFLKKHRKKLWII